MAGNDGEGVCLPATLKKNVYWVRLMSYLPLFCELGRELDLHPSLNRHDILWKFVETHVQLIDQHKKRG